MSRLYALLFLLCLTVAAEEKEPQLNQKFVPRLLEIAKEYESYGRVDDTMRFAPGLCKMVPPSVARFSASKDEKTHGQKLYFLFARDRDAYANPELKAELPQVVVKESWAPKEVPPESKKEVVSVAFADPKTKDEEFALNRYLPFAEKDGKVYHADKKLGLYIMFKTDEKDPESDSGWVYGTVSADGKQVTEAGKIASCMKCHSEAPHDRLFGLPKGTILRTRKK
jgi:hypothetical protein